MTRKTWMWIGVSALAVLGAPRVARASCASPANSIEAENCLAGTPASTWDVGGAGDLTIQGFPTDISVNKGSAIGFKVKTPASGWRLDIYRMGYYGGNGARLVTTINGSGAQNQPACLTDSTGLIDCGNWTQSASWAVPANAVSGIYFARAVRTDNQGASHIFFIVRDDASHSDVLFQASDETWHAYNDYGGNNLYTGNGAVGRAYKVSYNRPFNTRVFEPESWVFNAEYPMVRWLEANGYDVTYHTGLDADRSGALIKNHKVWMSNAHDEYWSGGQRANVEAARAAGVNLMFLSSNTSFWKTRWENSIDGSGTPNRTMVCYKETHANAVIDPKDPTTWTGTWRDPRFSPPGDGGKPENGLTGLIFRLNGNFNGAITVPQADGKMRIWRNTTVASLPSGQTATLAPGSLGPEANFDEDNGFRPPGMFAVSTTPVSTTVDWLLDYGSTYGAGSGNANVIFYRHSSGALVFSTGTYQWSWGLDANHDRSNNGATTDVRMQQATVNVYADMGVQPATLQAGLNAATQSTDLTPPVSSITSPAQGATLPFATPVTITGTATDLGGGVVGAVEVSTDGGATWHPAQGRESWSYSWTPGVAGSVTLKTRAVDDSGNLESPSAGKTVTVSPPASVSIWPSSATPTTVDGGADSAVELGVKFKADLNGTVKGIRFYKAATNTGTHIASLWTSTGTKLATATFSGETASGWQEVLFSSPVSITANTVYVASYHCTSGHYASDLSFFTSGGVDNAPLHALASGVSGPNGVYAYGAASTFPNQSFNDTNYWVDVAFGAPALSSIAVTPATPTISSGGTRQFTATGTYSDGSTTDLTAQAAWASSSTSVATINASGLASGVSGGHSTISATMSGISGSTVLSVQAGPLSVTTSSLPGGVVGNAYSATLAAAGGTAPYTWSITPSLPASLTLNAATGAISGSPTTAGNFNITARVTDSASATATKALTIAIAAGFKEIWSSSAVPTAPDSGPDSAAELGVKFKSDVTGSINGIRFYKAAANTGAHIGTLWSSTGTMLATATFTGETASGWQQVNFATPVSIAANTVYVASYHTTSGHYSDDANFFTSTGVDNAPLHALASGVSGPNGVFAYGAGSTFPNSAWNDSNYWVDVAFTPISLTSIAVTPASPSIAAGSTQQFTATGTFSDGSTQDVTSQATWASSSTAVATVNAAGLATGVSTGTSTISATLSGTSGSTLLTVVNGALTVVTSSLPGGNVGSAYSATLQAAGGTAPYSWSISGALPGGLTLNASTGIISGTPNATGTFNFTAQATDAASATASKALSIVVSPAPDRSIWASSTVPVNTDAGADSAVELGVKFKSDVSGSIDGIRFYKSAANTGAHTGTLWSITGTKLATATFAGETTSGWQQVNFATPVQITANTFYVASYHCSGGHYSDDAFTFSSSGVNNPPLHALATGVSGVNGVFGYGAASAFPSQGWNDSNYWVDVAFAPATLTSIALAPASPSISTGATQQFTATATYSDGSTQNVTSTATWASSSASVATVNSAGLATAVSAGNSTISAALNGVTGSTVLTVVNGALTVLTSSLPNGTIGLSYSATLQAAGGTPPYSWTVTGSLPPGLSLNGASGAISGTPNTVGTYNFTALATDTASATASKALSIAVSTQDLTIWASTAAPNNADGGPDSAVEVGVKFKSDVSGAIKGIRFYKSAANTGTHIGSLWSITGTKLASATFAGETATGWQQVNFATPVTITANTVYLASYHCTTGHYADDVSTFTSGGVNNPPLHALPSGVSGANGVFGYGASSTFPTQSFSDSNYWVDAVLTPSAISSIALTPASPTVPAGNTVQLTATATYSDGTTQDVTNLAAWASSATGVATVSSSGLVTGVSIGTATISATMNGVTGTTLLTVQHAVLTVSTSSLPGAGLNQAYQTTLQAIGGTPPYSWSVASLPAGLAVNPANGIISGAPTAAGSFNVTAQVTDSTPATASKALTIVVAPYVSVFPSTAVPGTADLGPDSALDVGMKFKSDKAIAINGVRFYKSSANTGTHVGSLWSITGTQLATATFSGETASGWQQVLFASPVSIAANTVYVVSYHTNVGHYAGDHNYFAGKGADNAPLHALADGVSGGDGVFGYGAGSTFPTQTFQATNYWVDVAATLPVPPALTSIAVTPANTSIMVGTTQQFTATGTYADTSTQNLTQLVTWAVSGETAPATIDANGLASGTRAGTITVAATQGAVTGNTSLTVQSTPLTISTTSLPSASRGTFYSVALTATGGATPYSWSLASGAPPTGLSLSAGGVITGTPTTAGLYSFTVKVADGSSQVATGTLSINVVPTTDFSLWTNNPTPGNVDAGADSSVEVGVRFTSDANGSITAIRFYKSPNNSTAHVGSLWTGTGTKLASVTFSGETASGWQQANFSTPVSITAGTVYVASYHTDIGHYALDGAYFGAHGLDNAPLHAPAASNGVFAYGSGSVFPNQTFNASNYWVDLVFRSTYVPPALNSIAVTPASPSVVLGSSQQFIATGTYADASTQDISSQVTWASSNAAVASISASGVASASQSGSATISATLGSTTGTTVLTVPLPPPPPDEGPGGPILVVSSSGNPFSRYLAEILRGEGLNEFLATDLSKVTSATLAAYDVVILGEMQLTASQVTMLSNWVNGGGNLIAMRPDKQLAGLLGLTDASSTLSNGYMLVAQAGAGAGIVSQTMQFHGTADLYTASSAVTVATLYSTASAATTSPAVTERNVGAGNAAAFTYDLARSVIYTRQGNPAWSGQRRDGQTSMRSDDLFFGAASFDNEADWVDFSKIQIPQADEQQRLLANLVLSLNSNKKPLPRFWYLPSGFKAAVVMTGDDHANGGTAGRFDQYVASSPANCSVADWQCVRGTSYIYNSSPITNAQTATYTAKGFEVALHTTTFCQDFTSYADLDSDFVSQQATFASQYSSAGAPVTNRTHCLVWSDYDTHPKVELAHGVRFDTNYYYWPASWVNDRPGLFTGSGMPQRFADRYGTTVDVYQATSQLTDESGDTYLLHIDTLLDNAIGAKGYYAVVTANMHTDQVSSAGSDTIVAEAQARGVPIVSAKQMLTWIDGRNGSSFGSFSWSNKVLGFSVAAAGGSRNIQALLPTQVGALSLSGLTRGGSAVSYTVETVKGVSYAAFDAVAGSYQATYH